MADLVDTASELVTYLEQARKREMIEYTVVYLKRRQLMSGVVRCSSVTEREQKMRSELGIDVGRSNWAAGYINPRGELELCGNNEKVKQELRKLFPRRPLAS